MTYALREGVWKHLTYTQQRNANGTSWTGILYEDGVEIGRTTNLTVAAERQRGGHQLQLPRPLAGAGALRPARDAAQLPRL